MPASGQEDEESWRGAFRRYAAFDHSPAALFDDLAYLAAQACETPMAHIALTGSEGMGFWSRSGLDFSDQATGCYAHTIEQAGLFEIADTLEDRRFASSPWVLASPGIRFFAGIPLFGSAQTPGASGEKPLGSLCVMDHHARCLTDAQKKALVLMAALFVQHLGLRENVDVLQSRDLARDKTEEALKQTLSLLEATLESTADGILVIDRQRKVLRYNRKFVKMWHLPEPELAAWSCDEAIAYLQNQLEDSTRFLSKMQDLEAQPHADSFDVLRFKDGRIFERYSHPQTLGEDIVGRVWSFRDTTERHEQAMLLQHRALHDALTNLPNRSLLQDRLQQAILLGRRESKSVAVILMDLDRFKEINDTLGHRYGDLLLQQVGPRIASVLRKSDTIARLGGDEFAVLLQGPITTGEASGFAGKILKALEASFVIEGMHLDVGASIGIALFPEHGDQAQALIQHADVAMYAAKNAGTGLSVYSKDQDQYSMKRLVLKGDLRHDIENGALFLLYQPKVSLKTGEVTGVEALVRWQHHQFGLVPPDQFIPLAEQTGLIKPLTLYVLKTALYQSLSWRKAGLQLPVAVNLSVRSLRDPRLIDQVVELLQVTGEPPESIELEITESSIMDDPARAMEIVTCLGRMGIRFSIDDFGTGYSSLGYLKRFPVQSVKIDKIFIQEMDRGREDEQMVRSIIELAHNLKLRVIAEGVEKAEIWNRLSDLRCDEAQGYFLSPPVTGQEVARRKAGWEKDFQRWCSGDRLKTGTDSGD